MKKFVLLVFALCVMLSGCSEDTKVYTDSGKELPRMARTVDISDGISKNGSSFSYSFDFDSDGEKEDISMKVDYVNKDTWEAKLMLSIGDYSTSLDMIDGIIDAVYACDIDTFDKVYDIAIITNEASDDPRIRILQYGPDFTPYQFGTDADGVTDNERWLGYAVSYYFNVNDDNSITLEEQTPSRGMWSVYKTYYRNDAGTFEEAVPRTYEILPDFMEHRLEYDTGIDDTEKAKWAEGYIKAYTDYTDGDEVIISAGEYIKPLYDNGRNRIMVNNEKGEQLWLNLEKDLQNFNPYYFFLAG